MLRASTVWVVLLAAALITLALQGLDDRSAPQAAAPRPTDATGRPLRSDAVDYAVDAAVDTRAPRQSPGSP